MKYHFANLAIICLLALSAGCKKKTDIEFIKPDKPIPVTYKSSKDNLGAILKNAAGKPEVFTVNATTGGKFTSSKGITYTIDPEIFIKPNGQTAEGNVNVAVSEITKASEMILNDMPTNAIITPQDSASQDSIKNPKLKEQGGMLNSFGEIKVEAKQNEEKLELKPGEEIKVEIPQVAVPEPIIPLISVPIWDTRPVKQQILGRDPENSEVTIEATGDAEVQTGIEWVKAPQVCQYKANNAIPSLSFEIPKLNVWRNCDVLVSYPRNTTVLGYFTNVFNNEADSLDRYNGKIQPNLLFFKKKGDNTLIHLYNHIRNAPNDKKGFLSYQDSFGMGMEGIFLALVNKDGKFYAEKKAVTIGEPVSGKTYFGVNFTLSEVTENQMLSLIESMNNE